MLMNIRTAYTQWTTTTTPLWGAMATTVAEGVQAHSESAYPEEVPRSPNFQSNIIDDKADEQLSTRLSAVLLHLVTVSACSGDSFQYSFQYPVLDDTCYPADPWRLLPVDLG